MVYRAAIYSLFFLSASIYFSYGVKLLKTRNNEPSPCEKFLGAPGWTIDILQNVTLDKWPWSCFPDNNIKHKSLDEMVVKSCPSVLVAARYGYIGFVQYYLRRESRPIPDSIKEDILLAAAESGNVELVKYLIDEEEFGVDPNDTQLLLHAARGGNVEMLGYLIFDKNLNRSGKSDMQQTALHCAAVAGQLKAVYFFVEILNFDVNARTRHGFTPAHYAAMTSLHVLRYLIDEAKANINAVTSAGESLLHFAAIEDELDIVKYLVEQKHMSVYLRTLRGETPLSYAIQGGSLANVKYFVEKRHVDINGTDMLGRSVLHVAARSLYAVMKYFVDDCKMVDRINDVDDAGNTPALEAVKFRSLSILRYLLDEKHANPDIVNKEGYDLMRKAVMELCYPIVKYLAVEKGFEIDEISYNLLTTHTCTADVVMCLWLGEYGRIKKYPGSVKAVFQRG